MKYGTQIMITTTFNRGLRDERTVETSVSGPDFDTLEEAEDFAAFESDPVSIYCNEG